MRQCLRFTGSWRGCSPVASRGGRGTASAPQAAEALAARAAQGAAALRRRALTKPRRSTARLVEQRPEGCLGLLYESRHGEVHGRADTAEAIAPLQKAWRSTHARAGVALPGRRAARHRARPGRAGAVAQGGDRAARQRGCTRHAGARYLALSKFAKAATQYRALTDFSPTTRAPGTGWHGATRGLPRRR